MPTLVELASQIVTAQATSAPMSTEEILTALSRIHDRLKQLETGETPAPETAEETAPQPPALSIKNALRKNEVVCMECGKGGFKTLARHLQISHSMKASEYRKKHGIPTGTPLASKSYSESRRKMAIDAGLGVNLAKARAVRLENLEKKKAAASKPAAAKSKAAKPAKTAKKAQGR